MTPSISDPRNAAIDGYGRGSTQDMSRTNEDMRYDTTDGVNIEHERRPLVGTSTRSDGRLSGVDIQQRRRSMMARIGSRLIVPFEGRENAESEGATQSTTQGSHTRGLRSSISNIVPPRWTLDTSHMLVGNSVRRRVSGTTNIRNRPIRGPFPLGHTEHQRLSFDNMQEQNMENDNQPSSGPADVGSITPSRSRLRRVRNSLSVPLQSLLRGSTSFDTNEIPQRSDNRSQRMPFNDDSTSLLPTNVNMDHRHEHDDSPHELDTAEPEARSLIPGARITSGMSTIRRFPQGLRSRSTRLVRRGEHPPLSQVLHLAAAAIAAQLSGHASAEGSGTRGFGGDSFDGSIQNFVQTLQDAAAAQAGEDIDINSPDGDLPPVNFMRVFQFPNDENGAPIPTAAQSRDPEQMDVENVPGGNENDRSVTLVLVGVRSMPYNQNVTGETGTLGGLDTLLNLPFLPTTTLPRLPGGSRPLLRQPTTPRAAHARRHSMTNFRFPAQYESQRHQTTRPTSFSPSVTPPTTTSPLSESPPETHPPPSTPAELRSESATPNRRPSSASAAQSSTTLFNNNTMSSYEPFASAPATTATSSSNANPTASPPPSSFPTSRRRSSSEALRRPELHPSSSRRHGVVEPDHPPSLPTASNTNSNTSTGRSWLIYIVGTNVSPDHPAFTMPSLFTDNPSYEDMQMLSTLLGPVKPPVATREDIASAGGLFRLVLQRPQGGDNYEVEGRANSSTGLLAENANGSGQDSILLAATDRCLICLSEYAHGEEVRQLKKCMHVYHRECVDEVSSTTCVRDSLACSTRSGFLMSKC